MKSRLVLLALFLPLFVSAKMKPYVALTSDEKRINSPIDCGAQEFNWFSLQAADTLPNPPELPGEGFNYNLVAPSESHRLRLDVCLAPATGKMTLKRILELNESRSILLIDVPADAKVQGLEEALAEGNPEKLKIEVAIEDDQNYLIEGRRSPKGAYATAVRTILQDGKWTPASIDFFAGVFGYGNSFVAGRCPLGQAFEKSKFRFGTAQFEAEYCAYQGVGETTDYDFVGLSVTDTNPALGAGRGKTVAFHSAEELKKVLVYKHNHHDACDSFHLTLPDAQYAATTAPVAGCGTPVAEAPVRRYDDSVHGVRYRLKYGASAWEDGVMTECGHYLFGCNVTGVTVQKEVAMLESAPPPYLQRLDKVEDFSSLARSEAGLTYVKYAVRLADAVPYFQDTNRYPYHFDFLRDQIPAYRNLGSAGYDDLLFTPGKKELSAGALYYDAKLRVPEYPADGLLGFVVYFHEGLDVAEVANVFQKLKAAAPFAAGRLAFAFERRADYFKFKSKLWPASCNLSQPAANCIPSLPLDRFKK